MLKDWECMTDLLLEEPGKDEEGIVYCKLCFHCTLVAKFIGNGHSIKINAISLKPWTTDKSRV